jgi:hypothetical protein
LLGRELPNQFKHAETWFPRRIVPLDEALVAERGQAVEERQRLGVGDRLDRREGAGAIEDGELRQELLLAGCEQGKTPVERGALRLLALGQGALAGGQ